jgi:hypothetical protein
MKASHANLKPASSPTLKLNLRPFLRLLCLFAAILPAADNPKGVDWSWPGRIMPAKSGGREGTRHFGLWLFPAKDIK